VTVKVHSRVEDFARIQDRRHGLYRFHIVHVIGTRGGQAVVRREVIDDLDKPRPQSRLVPLDQIDHVARGGEFRAGHRRVGGGNVDNQAVSQNEPDGWGLADFERPNFERFGGLGPGLGLDRKRGHHGDDEARDERGCGSPKAGRMASRMGCE
jgi:hypothetical protein